MSAFKPLWDRGELAIVHASRLARHHAVALRRAGLHGVGDAGREEHERRMAQSLPAGARNDAARHDSQPAAGGCADDADAARAAGRRAGAGHRQHRRLQRRRHGRAGVVRGDLRGGEGQDAARHRGRGLRRDANAATRKRKGTYRPANGAVYPRSPFGQALQEIARLAKADVGLEIAFAESTQWDHHVNEGAATGQIANRLDDFSRGIAALAQDLGERMADTVILTMSEFGRAVAENGSRGTDHGHGNAMFVIGGGVKGREVYGKWPGLAGRSALRGTRPRGHHRFPGRVQRGGRQAPRRRPERRPARVFPGLRERRKLPAAVICVTACRPRIIRPSGGCSYALGVGPASFSGGRCRRRDFRAGLRSAGDRSGPHGGYSAGERKAGSERPLADHQHRQLGHPGALGQGRRWRCGPGPIVPVPAKEVLALGAVGSVPSGAGVVDGDELPYTARGAQEEAREPGELADARSGDQVLPPRRAARHLHAVPVSDHPEQRARSSCPTNTPARCATST